MSELTPPTVDDIREYRRKNGVSIEVSRARVMKNYTLARLHQAKAARDIDVLFDVVTGLVEHYDRLIA